MGPTLWSIAERQENHGRNDGMTNGDTGFTKNCRMLNGSLVIVNDNVVNGTEIMGTIKCRLVNGSLVIDYNCVMVDNSASNDIAETHSADDNGTDVGEVTLY